MCTRKVWYHHRCGHYLILKEPLNYYHIVNSLLRCSASLSSSHRATKPSAPAPATKPSSQTSTPASWWAANSMAGSDKKKFGKHAISPLSDRVFNNLTSRQAPFPSTSSLLVANVSNLITEASFANAHFFEPVWATPLHPQPEPGRTAPHT
ncbi:hypothetical protein B0T14DRAFT_500837 [Immersiella caudata]|uniref:Uncharacterized protein n=1 Tax=Immersiella caudata TaxID=314043 RepID=A0AA39TT63_9PEZI|nr:hypothetical protein B0T14DRAFT_500837 [Immersiella caudata]